MGVAFCTLEQATHGLCQTFPWFNEAALADPYRPAILHIEPDW